MTQRGQAPQAAAMPAPASTASPSLVAAADADGDRSGGAASLVRIAAGASIAAIATTHAIAARADDAAATPAPLAAVAAAALAVAALWLAVGRFARVAGAVVLGLIVLGAAADARAPHPALIALGWAVMLVITAPPAPWGSLDARGRVSPGGDWRRPRWQAPLTRALLVAAASAAALALALHPSPADALSRWCPPLVGAAVVASEASVHVLLATLSAFATAWLLPGGRKWALLVGLGAAIWLALATGSLALPAAALVLMVAALAPGDLPAETPDTRELVLFDGHCGLCHGAVRWIIAEDRADTFDFAALGGETFAARVPPSDAAKLPDSVVVLSEDGRLLTQYAAVLHLLSRLGGVWLVLEWVLWPVPVALGDLGYRAVAAMRHRLWAQPSEACPLMPPEQRRRMLL